MYDVPNDNVPIWARPAPGARRPKFSREQIAAAALAIADAEGFEAVSMRRVASELGAGTMTLYYYVRTKDDLVALMDDAIMAAGLIPDGEIPARWRPAITMVAHHTRAAISRHPWALVSLRYAQMGPNAMRHFEQSLRALESTGLSPATKLEFLAVVDDYVHGHLLRAEEISTRTTAEYSDEEVEAMREWGNAQIATGEFPLMDQLNKELERSGGWAAAMSEDATVRRFDLGLQALLDGLAARYDLPE